MNHAQFWGGGGAAPYEIEQSLRFNSGDSTYLNWTPSSAGDRTQWTWSAWIKRSGLSSTVGLFGSYAAANNTDYLEILFASGNTLLVQGNNIAFLNTSQVFRDTSAWYHIVIAVDTSNATADDRIKIYVNGEQVTAFATRNNPGSGVNLGVNQAGVHRLGRRPNDTNYFDGYMAEVNFIDGSALAPTDFGELDDNGVWRPIRYAGSYTGNSFYLKFASGDGTDSSGLSNTWTANNFTTSGTGTDVMSDTPTTNYCTLNPIGTTYGFQTPTDGNLKTDANAYTNSTEGTFAIPKDGNLYYFEGTMTRDVGDGGTGLFFGCHTQGTTADPNSTSGKYFGPYGTDGGAYDGTQFFWQYSNYLGNAKGGHVYAGTVLGHAIKYDSGTWKYWYRQGSNGWHYWDGSSWVYNTSFDATEPTGSSSSVPESETLVPIGNNITFNFGQRDFEYTPPTGAKFLRSSDLPAPDIADGSDYFNTVLWSGNGVSGRAVTGVGFQPDFLWIKRRNGTVSHYLQNSVAGATNYMFSDDTIYERNLDDSVDSFDTDGFTLGNDGGTNASGGTYVGWNWLAGNGTSSISAGSIDGTNPTIASTVSANTTAGFSIVSYTGNGSSSATVGHGLGVVPSMIIAKSRDTGEAWMVKHKDLASNNVLELANTNASADATGFSNGSLGNLTSSTTFGFVSGSIGVDSVNKNNDSVIAYCFAEVEGFSKFGYVSGLENDEFVYLGFSPAWIMFKRTSTTSNWAIRDSKRDTYNITSKELEADTSDAESTFAALDFLSNGFKARSFTGVSGGWIYAAFAEHPFGGSGVSPATAR